MAQKLKSDIDCLLLSIELPRFDHAIVYSERPSDLAHAFSNDYLNHLSTDF